MTMPTINPLTLRGRLLGMISSHETERASFISHWKELAEFIQPRKGRFTVTDVNRGDRRTQKIIDSTGTLAKRTLSSGMMSGITSPARRWFRLATPDPDLGELDSVKVWLHIVTERIFAVMSRSNFYNSTAQVFDDIGTFATAAMAILDDDEKVIRCETYPIGSYCIGIDAKGRPSEFSRRYQMKVSQVVQQFGLPANARTFDNIDWTNISTHVKKLWEGNQYSVPVEVAYCIYPNYGIGGTYDGVSRISKNKRFQASYLEMSTDSDKILQLSGFDEFPILAPRWSVTGEDTYGTDCPGMTALGDIKSLQLAEKRGAQALEKMVNPPLTGPTSLRRATVSLLAGAVTYNDPRDAKTGLRPIHEVRLTLQDLEFKQEQKRMLINRAYFTDLFLMLASNPQLDNGEKTAREIEERHEEKLLALGPMLENFNVDFSDPAIDRIYNIMERRGMIPPPPEELDGAILKVEYQSIMAQAQKMVGIGGLERTAQFATNLATLAQDPSILDKFDTDQAIDEHAEMTGIPPQVIRPDDVVKRMREDRAQAQKAAQDAATMKDMSTSAKNLSQSDTRGDNALTDLMRGLLQGGGVPEQELPGGQAPEDVQAVA